MTKLISIVVPLYNEELIINELYARLSDIIDSSPFDFEVILVNDGSQDQTFAYAKTICKTDKKYKLVSFSRNFGHQIAITAGMDRSRGDAIVIIDADLQDPPEVILKMIEKWREGFQVVYGKRKKRKGESFFKLATASLFYRMLRFLTNVNIPIDTGDFRLMDKCVVNQLKNMREKSRFVRGMVSWVGFRQCEIEYVREKRFAGETKYPINKMLKFAIDGILSFSQAPLRVSSLFGFFCSIISFGFIVYGLTVKFFFPDTAISGWASTFIAVLFVGGVQLICAGIIGEYIGRIYEEIKNRPLYISNEEINFD